MPRSGPDAVIGAALDQWDSQLEQVLFGTTDPAAIAGLLDGWCRTHLGHGVLSVEFYRRGVGAVAGLQLADASTAVVKVHRPELVGDRLERVGRVQRFPAEGGLPAPRPLAPPAPLGLGVATAEEMVDRGHAVDAHDPAIRAAMARGLWELVQAARPLVATARLGPWPPFDLPPDRLWPVPHDLRFDFTLPGGEWIDRLALAARDRLRDPSGPVVIGHMDWRVENLRVEGDRIVAIFDWDSVGLVPEPALVGHNAAGFTADWSNPDIEQLPTVEESRAFVADYEAARGRPFTGPERRTADAAYRYSVAYGARCEHSDATLGIFPDAGLDRGWRGLLRHVVRTRLVEP